MNVPEFGGVAGQSHGQSRAFPATPGRSRSGPPRSQEHGGLFSVGVWFAASLPDACLDAPVVQQTKIRICPCSLPSAMMLE